MSDRRPESTGFLYPFIDADERDPDSLLVDLAESARTKLRASEALRAATLTQSSPRIGSVAAALAGRFGSGGRLFSFGNGGSSTDAANLVALFVDPPWGASLPARALVDDSAVLTAIGNDVGFELVFSRQLIAHASSDDIALGMSTSGNSRNLLAAFEEASRRGMLTIGIAGYSGGDMGRSPFVEHCLVVEADSVHRIQEAQAALGFAVWQAVQSRLVDAGTGTEAGR